MKTKIIRKDYDQPWSLFEIELNEFVAGIDLVDIKLTETRVGDHIVATALVVYRVVAPAEREPFDLGDWLADQHHKAQLLADSIDEGDTEETAALLEQQAQAWVMLQEMAQSGELVHQS